MVRMRTLMLLLVSLAPGSRLAAQSASPYVPLQYWGMPYVEHLIAAGAMVDPTPLTRPLRRADLIHALHDVDTLAARGEIRRAHVWTPVTRSSRIPASAFKKKRIKPTPQQ